MGYTWTDGELITATKLNNTGGAKYDAVIKLDDNTIHDASSATVISGSFTNMATKALNEEPLIILVYGADDTEGHPYTTTFCVLKAYYDNYMYDPEDHTIEIVIADFLDEDSCVYIGRIAYAANNTASIWAKYYITTTGV